MATLVRLSVTPVKALRLSHPREAEVTEHGIPADRRFYLIDEAGALFDATEYGALLRIVSTTTRRPSGSGSRSRTARSSRTERTSPATRSRPTSWGRSVTGRVVEGPFADAVSAYVGAAVRLVRARKDGDAQDVQPLTIVSSASVRDLGARGDRSDLDGRRFRINLEVDGVEPYEEDTWDGHDASARSRSASADRSPAAS